MKKKILKITGIMALTMLIAVNVTSTMKFSTGGQEVIAGGPDKIPCYSAYQQLSGWKMVYCEGCKTITGKHSGTLGTCTSNRD